MMKLWNTKTRKLEELKPITPGKIGFYACGPTVYQRAHIGNLRTYVMEDVLRRVLERLEHVSVKHVVNITDVGHLTSDADTGEDKLEKAAREEGKDAWEISKRYTAMFVEDIAALNILEPSSLPKATDHISEQVELVKALEERGYTYKTSDGIYFDTSKFNTYGALGGQRLEEKEEGVRVEANPEKKNAADFALWKFSPSGEKRQMEWESPWGVGFPGWHIECSAMSRKELGQPFDIHAGGIDHIPVHHENEIAQSEAAYGVPLANYWMHIEFLLVNGQKMSKSLKNDFTMDDVRQKGISPLAYRLFLLGANYRSKQNFTWEALQGTSIALEKLYRIARGLEAPGIGCAEFESDFKAALLNDLNTPEALAVMWKMIDSDQPGSAKARSLVMMDEILGFGLADVVSKPLLIPIDIKNIADARWKARSVRDWKTADSLRKELDDRGWIVMDHDKDYSLERK